jgi:uncharacterized iron-regulated membrane protein
MVDEEARPNSNPLLALFLGLLIAGLVGALVWAQSRSETGANATAATTTTPTAAPSPPTSVADPPLSACQAVARWASLAVPGANDPLERQAWAEVQAQMATTRNPVAIEAVDSMADAFNRGSSAVTSAMAEQVAAYNAQVNDYLARDQAALDQFMAEYQARSAAGDYSLPPPPSAGQYPLPDPDAFGDATSTAQANALIEIDQAHSRFMAECR